MTELGSKYDSSDQRFLLSMQTNKHSLVAIGKDFVVHLSKNLSRLFGIPDGDLRFSQKSFIREIAALSSNREEAIYILSNVIKPTA